MAERLKTVIVDDEQLALESLRQTLGGLSDVDIVASFKNGREAASAIPNLRPDLLFLDIQMPGLDGLQVAQALMGLKDLHIIFVTAYSEHALHAFRVHALDYILKPYQDDQILAAVDRVRQKRGRQMPSLEKLEAFLQQVQTKPTYQSRLLVKEGRRALIVQTDEIIWIRGARNYVELHTAHKTYLYRQTLNQLETELDPAKFARIHRSKMVNLNELICLEKPAKNQVDVITRDGGRHTVSSAYRLGLEEALKG